MPFPDMIQPELGAYVSGVGMPGDFAQFWTSTIAEARQAGGEVGIVQAQTTLKAVQSFDVTFPGYGGHPIKGWLILPTHRKGRLPLVVQYIGYGGGRGLAHEQLHWAASGFAYFRMDTRGQGSDWSVGATADPVGSTSSIPGFMTRGVLDRNDYYYRRLFTDAVRAIDALVGQDFVDPERIAVCGDSQGGGISLAVGGIDPRVKAVMPDVPFLCDFPRAVQTAVRDPYLEIVRFLAQHREKKAKVFETLNYFDCVNFARQSKAAALFSVALMDEVCPPSTVYGAFNAYAGHKTIVEYEFNNHEGGQCYQEREQMAWLGGLFGVS
ncbi:MAG: acetylxylan esterase [Mesorhizobium sp.]|uniref:acetylxylan esterase n=1 Tax=Mesorhizobium sp. TaxID=1871066 RepID=UPI0011F54CC2|nr:acetylxylan esterase [Mesorhizobium sp.]TIO52169.1 MAG: acetylxylan esterase [Mesorhizobium sp.]TIO60833.1 MAG: acetylxylan esterase [Mesorhizobium sp.]TJV65379.1 MAG: acetylxylan esterase [Mesorhizobium sp.]